MSRTHFTASRCVIARTPAPSSASSFASSRASSRVASPETAAVRIAVIVDASAIASSFPCSASNSSTTPMCESYGVASFPGKTVMIFAPSDAPAPFPTTAGIAANAFGVPSSRITVRNGSTLEPSVTERSAPAMTSMHSLIGNSARTSAPEISSVSSSFIISNNATVLRLVEELCSPRVHFSIRIMMRRLAVLVLSSAISTAAAAQSRVFTHADTLRGSNGPARAWWKTTFYDLHVRVHPADSSIAGYNGIVYRVLEPRQEMQIDLQPPMMVDSMIQDGTRRSVSPRRQCVFRRAHEAAAHRRSQYDHGVLSTASLSPQRIRRGDGGYITLAARQPRQHMDCNRERRPGRERLVAEQGHSFGRARQSAHRDHRSRSDGRRFKRPPAQHDAQP